MRLGGERLGLGSGRSGARGATSRICCCREQSRGEWRERSRPSTTTSFAVHRSPSAPACPPPRIPRSLPRPTTRPRNSPPWPTRYFLTPMPFKAVPSGHGPPLSTCKRKYVYLFGLWCQLGCFKSRSELSKINTRRDLFPGPGRSSLFFFLSSGFAPLQLANTRLCGGVYYYYYYHITYLFISARNYYHHLINSRALEIGEIVLWELGWKQFFFNNMWNASP